MARDLAEKASKKSKYSAARWVGSPNISKIKDQFLAVLKREALILLDESHKGKLSAEASKNLIQYLKLLRDLDKPEVADPQHKGSAGDEEGEPETDPFTDLTDEELKKMATKTKPGESNV